MKLNYNKITDTTIFVVTKEDFEKEDADEIELKLSPNGNMLFCTNTENHNGSGREITFDTEIAIV